MLDLALIVGAAVVASFVALLVWAEERGRAFGSRTASKWAAGVILALAGSATVLGGFVLAPLTPQVEPFWYGLVLPFSLCGRKILGIPPGDPGEKTKVIPAVLSVGVSLLLTRLSDAMAMAMTEYVYQPAGCKSWPMKVLEKRAEELHGELIVFIGDDRVRQAKIDRNIRDLRSYIQRADKAVAKGDERGARSARNCARHAYWRLRRLAYLWRYDESQLAEVVPALVELEVAVPRLSPAVR
jgi:hypothetical protein